MLKGTIIDCLGPERSAAVASRGKWCGCLSGTSHGNHGNHGECSLHSSYKADPAKIVRVKKCDNEDCDCSTNSCDNYSMSKVVCSEKGWM
ncbi:hypothetical protein L3Y34_017434 [Caenorhabditis briggsae]|uniref:Uncharacterized protein n=1 Tax=Caenorhabditis briggsae TaxID=6238 RepID=A0AAE9DIA0_CAEBR|nr:hypothetical protein L3Y34_017434 [Caenorhabditis briggsae]